MTERRFMVLSIDCDTGTSSMQLWYTSGYGFIKMIKDPYREHVDLVFQALNVFSSMVIS